MMDERQPTEVICRNAICRFAWKLKFAISIVFISTNPAQMALDKSSALNNLSRSSVIFVVEPDAEPPRSFARSLTATKTSSDSFARPVAPVASIGTPSYFLPANKLAHKLRDLGRRFAWQIFQWANIMRTQWQFECICNCFMHHAVRGYYYM